MIQNTNRSHLQATWLVIVNPQSGNGRLEQEWPLWEKRLTPLLNKMEVRFSAHPGNATALIQEGVSKGLRHILGVGGDGTAHQVINGIMTQQEVPSNELIFALLPVGTGNDWIKSHGIPRQWEAWRTYFQGAQIHRQNLGHIQYLDTNQQLAKRFFLNVAGLAYDAFVVRATAGEKSWLPSKLFYFWSTFRCLFKYTPQEGILSYNQKTIQKAFYTINLGIGKYSGGGMQLVPHAQANGDSFALTFVGQISRLEVLLNSFRFYKGRIAQYNKAVLEHTAHIIIKALPGQDILVEADGEFLGHSPTQITLKPLCLSFLAPNN